MTLDYRWSPDGQYLSYSPNDSQRFFLGVIWSVADGKSRRVTPQYFIAQSAAWAPAVTCCIFECARISAVDQQHLNSISRPIGRLAYSR